MDPEFEKLFNAWDGVDSAIRNLSTAMPDRLTERYKELEAARVEFADIMRQGMLAQARAKG